MFGPFGLSKTHLALLIGAIAFCVVVLWVDIGTSADITEAFLYSLAFIAIYPLKRDWATLLVLIVGIICTILGGMLEDEGEGGIGGIINRGNAIIVMCGVGLLLWKVASVERVLFRLSTADPLTGAYNRRHFMAVMEQEQKRAERYATSFSLLMLDIDHFKRLNDNYGHPVGDEAIKAMAAACQKHLRPTDMLCCYGGEEFIISLPHTDEAGAVIAGERIREAVSQIAIPAGDQTVRFTVSIGVTSFVKKSRLEQLIACADHALYAAKQGGRNQVRVGHLADLQNAVPA
jgi:diguanylate cyclase (GGDEF)-like protein